MGFGFLSNLLGNGGFAGSTEAGTIFGMPRDQFAYWAATLSEQLNPDNKILNEAIKHQVAANNLAKLLSANRADAGKAPTPTPGGNTPFGSSSGSTRTASTKPKKTNPLPSAGQASDVGMQLIAQAKEAGAISPEQAMQYAAQLAGAQGLQQAQAAQVAPIASSEGTSPIGGQFALSGVDLTGLSPEQILGALTLQSDASAKQAAARLNSRTTPYSAGGITYNIAPDLAAQLESRDQQAIATLNQTPTMARNIEELYRWAGDDPSKQALVASAVGHSYGRSPAEVQANAAAGIVGKQEGKVQAQINQGTLGNVMFEGLTKELLPEGMPKKAAYLNSYVGTYPDGDGNAIKGPRAAINDTVMETTKALRSQYGNTIELGYPKGAKVKPNTLYWTDRATNKIVQEWTIPGWLLEGEK